MSSYTDFLFQIPQLFFASRWLFLFFFPADAFQPQADHSKWTFIYQAMTIAKHKHNLFFPPKKKKQKREEKRSEEQSADSNNSYFDL